MTASLYPVNEYRPIRRPEWYLALVDTWIMTRRSLLHIIKNRDQVLGLTIQPAMFMLLFRYVFGGAIDTGPVNYVNFLMAGILIQSVAFGSLTTSISVATDLQRGIIDRFKSLPIFGLSAVIGHVAADIARNVIQVAVMLLIGILVGFRPSAGPLEWFMIAGLIILFAFAISWLAAIIGLMAKTIEAVQWMGFFLVFPLTFASAAFVPTSTMPGILRAFAENQPVTHVIEAIRALMNGLPAGDHVWLTVAWSLGIIAVSAPLTAHLFRNHAGR
jgi:ABC-2 type transport system permease protein